MPADEHVLEILLKKTQRILPKATWTAAGIGRHQTEVMEWVRQPQAGAVQPVKVRPK